MDDLKEWIKSEFGEKRGSQAEAARRIGTSAGCLHNLLTGRRKPSGHLAAKIETATGGKVKMLSFYAGE